MTLGHPLASSAVIPRSLVVAFLVLLSSFLYKPFSHQKLPHSFFYFFLPSSLPNLAEVGDVRFLGPDNTFSGWSPNKLSELDLNV